MSVTLFRHLGLIAKSTGKLAVGYEKNMKKKNAI